MKTIQRKATGSIDFLASCAVLTACSSEGERVPPAQVESNKQSLAAVPEDGSDFQVEATIDEDGHVTRGPIRTGPGVPVPGFDPASLPRKPAEAPEPPRQKIARSLAAKLRPTDPNATTEVVVSVAHDAHFSPLPMLLRDEPRSSTENSRRVAARLSAIAAVDSRRKPFRTAVANHASAHGALVTEEFTMGNGLAMTIPDSAVEALANHPNVVDISPATTARRRRGPSPTVPASLRA